MATPLAIGNITATQAICTCPGQIASRLIYYRVLNVVGGPPPSTGDLALAMDVALAPKLKALMAPRASYYGVQSRTVFPISLERWVPSITLSGVGTATGNQMASQTCGLLHLVGSVLGGAGAGRWYLPFPSIADDDVDASPGVTYQTHAATLAAFVKAQLVVTAGGSVATLQPVLFNTTTKVDNFIQDAYLKDAWATQKSRGAFGKMNALPF